MPRLHGQGIAIKSAYYLRVERRSKNRQVSAGRLHQGFGAPHGSLPSAALAEKGGGSPGGTITIAGMKAPPCVKPPPPSITSRRSSAYPAATRPNNKSLGNRLLHQSAQAAASHKLQLTNRCGSSAAGNLQNRRGTVRQARARLNRTQGRRLCSLASGPTEISTDACRRKDPPA